MNLTAEQRLHRSHVTLMNHKKFILMSGIFVSGTTEVVEDESGVKTACTDGLNTLYNRNFVTSLDDKELNFLVLHENWHKALKHMIVWRHLHNIDHKLANMACDYVINLLIRKYDPEARVAVMPKNGLYDDRFEGMDTKQVFDILREEQESGDGNSGGQGDGSFDDHDWEKADGRSPEEVKQAEKQIDQALRQGEVLLKKRGDAGSGGDRAFGELLEPVIDPYELLREFMVNQCNARDDSSWRRPNRRFVSQDIYMPSSISESLADVVMGVDMSGSIGGAELNEFFTEFTHICESVPMERLHLMYWDTKVCAHEIYENADLERVRSSTKPAGGGGTDADCIPRYMKSNNVTAQVVIIFTDGYIGKVREWAGMPPTLWVISKGGNKNVEVAGKKICL